MLPIANSSVVFQKLDEGAVLFAPETEVYFGLNDVGALIWELLPPRNHTLEELCESVSARYPEVPLATIRSDVAELLAQLIADGLARHADTRGTDAAATS